MPFWHPVHQHEFLNSLVRPDLYRKRSSETRSALKPWTLWETHKICKANITGFSSNRWCACIFRLVLFLNSRLVQCQLIDPEFILGANLVYCLRILRSNSHNRLFCQQNMARSLTRPGSTEKWKNHVDALWHCLRVQLDLPDRSSDRDSANSVSRVAQLANKCIQHRELASGTGQLCRQPHSALHDQ